MIMGRGLGVAGWERECVPHRRIRHRLDYRLFVAIGFSPHTVIRSEGVFQVRQDDQRIPSGSFSIYSLLTSLRPTPRHGALLA